MFLSEMCKLRPEQKLKNLVKLVRRHLSAVNEQNVRLLVRNVSTWAERRKPLFQKKRKKSDCGLQIHAEPKTFIFRDMSCGLMKLKWNCLEIMAIATSGGKRGMLLGKHVVWLFYHRRNWDSS